MGEDGATLFRQDDAARSTATLIELSVATNLLIFEIAQATNDMVYRDPLPGGTTRVNIERVRDREERRFRSIVNRFPWQWPPVEQGAYILRAYSGLQIFPDANHRTGLAMSRIHLRQHGLLLDARLDEWKALVSDLKSQHGVYFSRCKADAIAARNKSFHRVADFYATHARPRNILDTVRERFRRRARPGDLAFWDDEAPTAEAARKSLRLDEPDSDTTRPEP